MVGQPTGGGSSKETCTLSELSQNVSVRKTWFAQATTPRNYLLCNIESSDGLVQPRKPAKIQGDPA